MLNLFLCLPTCVYRDPELTLTRIAYVKALLCLDNSEGGEGRISDSGSGLALVTQAYEDLTASAPMAITQTPHTSHLSSNSTAATTNASHEGKGGHNSDPSAARLSFDLCTAIVTDHIRTTRVLNETNYNEVKNILCLKISMYRANKHYTSVIIWAELALRLLESYHLSATSHFSTLSTSTSSTHVECDKVYNDWTSITLYKADALTCLAEKGQNSESLALTLSLIPTTKSVKVLVAVYKTAILYKGAEYALRLLIHVYTTIHSLNEDNTTTATPPWKTSNNSNIALKKSLLAAESIAGPLSLHTLATTQTTIYVNFAELLIMCHDCVINELEKGQNYDHRSVPVLSLLIVYSARILLHTAWLQYYIHSKGWRKLGALGQELQPINRYSGEEDADDKQTFLNVSCQVIRLFLDKHLQQRDVVMPSSSSTRQQLHAQQQLETKLSNTNNNISGPDRAVDARPPVDNAPNTNNTDATALSGNKRPRIDDNTTTEAPTVPCGDISHTLTTTTDTIDTCAAEEGVATMATEKREALPATHIAQEPITTSTADKNSIEAIDPDAPGEVDNMNLLSPPVTKEDEHGTEESPHKKQALLSLHTDSALSNESHNQTIDTSELVTEVAVNEAVVVEREETAREVVDQGDNTVLDGEATSLTLVNTTAADVVEIAPGQGTVDRCAKEKPHNSDPSPPAEDTDIDSQTNRYHALFPTSTSSASEANETDDLIACWMDSSNSPGHFEFDCSLDDLCICVYSRLQDADSVLRVVQSEEEGCDVSAVGSYFHLEWLAGVAWLVIIYACHHMYLIVILIHTFLAHILLMCGFVYMYRMYHLYLYHL